MYGCNQARELIDSDAVFRNVTADDMRDQAGIELVSRLFLGHVFSTNYRVAGSIWLKFSAFSIFSARAGAGIRFTDGFGTTELKEAKALLQELGA